MIKSEPDIYELSEASLCFFSSNSQFNIRSYRFLPPQYLSEASISLHLHCFSSPMSPNISLGRLPWINYLVIPH